MKRILIAIRLTLIPIPPSGPPPWSSVPEWGNAITIIMNEHIVPFIIRIISYGRASMAFQRRNGAMAEDLI